MGNINYNYIPDKQPIMLRKEEKLGMKNAIVKIMNVKANRKCNLYFFY
jgi:hypothetical protein